jgi:ribose 5-phosphate isomerase A
MVEQVARLVPNGATIGLGSGATVARFVAALGRRVREEGLEIKAVPSSLQITLVAQEHQIPLAPPEQIPEIALTVDGADQIDSQLNMIKGGGGALFRERILLEAAQERVIVADEGKFTRVLDREVPVEVSPFARTLVEHRLKELGGTPRLRLLAKGYPYITENGNLIFDVDFGPIKAPGELEEALRQIPGVVAVGIFTLKAEAYYKAKADGEVEVIEP